MAETLRNLGFGSCKADADVWMRAARKPDGSEFYEYLLAYVDDILIVSLDPDGILKSLAAMYTIKPGSEGEPKIYLGANIK